ncbi:molybdenum cofactor sulfurase-like isoform X1 [Acyrthosiphon pisum]|uniref:Molybdenum cofactor sulfurase n=2 Tax=Acyrthosiphon pisum TaxID=7029 RepID=A0A8R2NKY8_ACYPI|nr:molybdenum cofactor sulfurase-like isoform X1 [Acyrthosiphon pisum]
MFPKVDESELIKNEFSRLKGICYLDHVGSALYADSQINNVMKDLKMHLYGNPHSTGDPSATCEKRINSVRFKILEHFNTGLEKYSVIFTSGATEALKTVAECFAWDDEDGDRPEDAVDSVCRSRGSTFAYTEDNHTSVLGMRELAPMANLLCLTRNEAHEALDKMPSSSAEKNRSVGSRNSLFVFPAQSNFAGTKYPLEWIETCQEGALDQYTGNRVKSRWFTVLDASSYVPTNHLDLEKYSPDFVTVSFYKMFGYPTGLGALLVRNKTAAAVLRRKKYFGGGTVEVVLARNRHHVLKKNLHEKFEDGTVDFLSAIAVGHGLDTLRALAGPMREVAGRTFRLAAYLYGRMSGVRHGNGLPVFRTYADTEYRCESTQGGVVNFNVLRANGDYVGYNEVKYVASNYGIVLRVGCFCNPGACQTHLGHTDEELRRNQEVIGHICGDHIDIINGRPTGSVRVSFGYQSSESDANRLYDTLIEQFWQKNPVKPVDRQQNSVDEYNRMDLHVSRLFVFPIKSCGAYETDEWQLETYGFQYDRNWAVVSTSGVCMTQMEDPKLCLVKPYIDLQKGTMTLVYAENEDEVPMVVPLDTKPSDTIRMGKICWGGHLEGMDCGDEVAEWLSWNLDRPGLRLVRCTSRTIAPKSYDSIDPRVIGSNQCQYLLSTQSTIKWLQQEMENEIAEIDEDNLLYRFRGNFLISGDSLPPFGELTWQELDIGGVKFEFVEGCERCKMVNIDQDTSESIYKPLSILGQHKWEGKLIFGIYMQREDTQKCKIRVGQKCTVTKKRN